MPAPALVPMMAMAVMVVVVVRPVVMVVPVRGSRRDREGAEHEGRRRETECLAHPERTFAASTWNDRPAPIVAVFA